MRGSSPSRARYDDREDPDEDRQLHGVRARADWQHGPQEPQHRLRNTDGPHRAVEKPALVPFAGRGPLDPGHPSGGTGNPDRNRDRKIRNVVAFRRSFHSPEYRAYNRPARFNTAKAITSLHASV